MKKHNTNSHGRVCLLMLLLLSVVGARAQTSLQFWFDDDKTIKQADIPTSGTQEGKIDVSSLPQGFHTMYMRAKSSITEYPFSPVSTVSFFKFAASGGSLLEYWFDDDFDGCSTMSVATDAEAEQVLELDLIDSAKFPLGIHRLNFRLSSGGQHSPVYSAIVLKSTPGPKNHLTYWLDDDYRNRKTYWSTSSNGKETSFVTMLRLDDAAAGMHRLKFQITTDGVADGPVSEVPILVTRLYNNLAEVKIATDSSWLDEAMPLNKSLTTSMATLYTAEYTLDPALIGEGQHEFHIQYKNSAEVWSAQNVTYFYKEAATGRLRAGRLQSEETAINDITTSGTFNVYTLDGLLVAKEVETLKGLAKGVYIVRSSNSRMQGSSGRKVVVK